MAVLTNCHRAVRVKPSSSRSSPAGRPQFRTPTHGVSTAVKGFPLSDGSTLALTVCVMADRTLVHTAMPSCPTKSSGDQDNVCSVQSSGSVGDDGERCHIDAELESIDEFLRGSVGLVLFAVCASALWRQDFFDPRAVKLVPPRQSRPSRRAALASVDRSRWLQPILLPQDHRLWNAFRFQSVLQTKAALLRASRTRRRQSSLHWSCSVIRKPGSSKPDETLPARLPAPSVEQSSAVSRPTVYTERARMPGGVQRL